MRLGFGLGLALASAVALNWGYFAQHGGASALPRLELRRPLHSVGLLLGNRRWLAGFLAGFGGWGLYLGALVLAPLSLVQAVSAGGIGVLALLVHLGPGDEQLTRREWTAVGVAFAGLALLAVSLAGAHHTGRAPSWVTAGVWLLALAGGAAAVVCSIGVGAPAAAALGAASGVLYATGDVATKAVVASVGLFFVPAIFAAHGLGFVCLQLGFQRGSALVTAGPSILLTNALPIAAGTVLFHEGLPPGALGDCRVASFALVTAGAALLARA